MSITPKRAGRLIGSWRTTIGGLLSLAGMICAFIPVVQVAAPILTGIGGAMTGINALDHKTASKTESK